MKLRTQRIIAISALAFVAVMAEAQEPMGPPENGQGMGRQMGPGGQRMMGPRIPNGGPGILMIPEVQTELKLSDSQIVKIKKILPQPPQARQGARGEVPLMDKLDRNLGVPGKVLLAEPNSDPKQ